LEIVACSVTAELEPAVAVPVPDPLEVKYANATPATARAQVQPSAINALFLVIQRILSPYLIDEWKAEP
jgi:hypothetical protein